MKDHSFSPARRGALVKLGQSPLVRLSAALALLAVAGAAAWALWAGRDAIALVALLLLGLWAVSAFRAFLPVSPATRAAWVRKEELAARYPSYRYRAFFWLGLGALVGKAALGKVSSPVDAAVPLLAIAVGALAIVVWRFRHAKHAAGA